MFLTVDIGNTNIKIAVFEKEKQICFKRFETRQANYRYYFEELFKENNLYGLVKDAIISCVVPELKDVSLKIIDEFIDGDCVIVDHNLDCGISIDTDYPEGVGSDLIVMCAYAYHLTHSATIVMSFGTANVMCYIDNDACFKYCIIAPGLLMQVQALFSNAAKLPPFKLEKQDSCLTNQTIAAMNIGVIDGSIGACKYLVDKMKSELGINEVKIIASGGLGKVLIDDLSFVDDYIPDLVTEGLKYIYLRKKDTNE